MTEDLLGRYEELPFPLARTATVDTVRIGMTRHHIPVLLEVDVTAARAELVRRRRAGRDDSFTAWAVACIARAAAEHKRVHALRRGRGRLVVFDDVDVALAVFRQTNDADRGERIPMPFVVRRANEKPVDQIGDEIRRAQTQPLAPGEQWLSQDGRVPPPRLVRLAFAAPFHLRKWLFWDRLLADPFRVKRTMGTVMVTSVPLSTRSGTRGWAVPVGIHPLSIALGAIAQLHEPERELLSMTVLFDHDVTDGLPVALFLRRLTGLMEAAHGLEPEAPAG